MKQYHLKFSTAKIIKSMANLLSKDNYRPNMHYIKFDKKGEENVILCATDGAIAGVVTIEDRELNKMLSDAQLSTGFIGAKELSLFIANFEFQVNDSGEDLDFIETEVFFSKYRFEFPNLNAPSYVNATTKAERFEIPISFDLHLLERLSNLVRSLDKQNDERAFCKIYSPKDQKAAVRVELYNRADHCVAAEIYLMPLRPN